MTELEIKSLKQQYATPWAFMDWSVETVLVPRGRGRFGLDVCASAENAKAPIFFDEAANGLEQSWQLDDLAPAWCNPPFKDVQPWLEKARGEAQFGGVLSCVLTHMDHSTDWYRAGMSLASEVIHVNPRINFVQHPKLLEWMKENKIKPGGNDKQNTLWVFDPEWLPSSGEQAVMIYPRPWR